MFITFEGPEGAGKSTVIKKLALTLEEAGYSVLLTREPGAGEVGKAIRQILLDSESLSVPTELFLFLADRANHVETLIRPALMEHKVVLCDRYSDSTLVYQGYGRGIALEELWRWNDFATDGLVPTRTYLLDLSPEVGLARLESKDRLDSESLDFHQRVRHGFLSEASKDPARWRVIDAALAPEEVFQLISEDLAGMLKT